MIVLIDNYDSFTWNVVHLIGGLGHEVSVHRHDQISVDKVLANADDAIVLSPGPGRPDAAGICLPLIEKAAQTATPVFGICLGVQAIAKAFGGRIIRAPTLRHGKTSTVVRTKAPSYLEALPTEFVATRYHSLVADPDTLPACLNVTAHSADDGEIMALDHESLPKAGVQFHPESIASDHGAALFSAFLAWAKKRQCSHTDQGAHPHPDSQP
ncbi:MAG: aminodeoxychorismate/anthranilate synthase component II [Pseudomonadota bacterium]